MTTKERWRFTIHGSTKAERIAVWGFRTSARALRAAEQRMEVMGWTSETALVLVERTS